MLFVRFPIRKRLYRSNLRHFLGLHRHSHVRRKKVFVKKGIFNLEVWKLIFHGHFTMKMIWKSRKKTPPFTCFDRNVIFNPTSGLCISFLRISQRNQLSNSPYRDKMTDCRDTMTDSVQLFILLCFPVNFRRDWKYDFRPRNLLRFVMNESKICKFRSKIAICKDLSILCLTYFICHTQISYPV